MIGRVVVVNADDFGRSDGINRGIIEAHEHGIVTSASLMVLWPAASDAAAYALEHPELSVGLHVDLGEWVWRDGMWPAVYERADLTEREAVDREIRSQLERCRDLLGSQPDASRLAPAHSSSRTCSIGSDCARQRARRAVATLRPDRQILRRLLWPGRSWGASPAPDYNVPSDLHASPSA